VSETAAACLVILLLIVAIIAFVAWDARRGGE